MAFTVPDDFGDITRPGRCALVAVMPAGAIVFATDAQAASVAAAVMVDLFTRGDRSRLSAPWQWALELAKTFPAEPSAGCPLMTATRGLVDVDAIADTFEGMGFVRPAGAGHECGAAIIGPASRQVRMVQPAVPCVIGPATGH